jgi:hypothetical protein
VENRSSATIKDVEENDVPAIEETWFDDNHRASPRPRSTKAITMVPDS